MGSVTIIEQIFAGILGVILVVGMLVFLFYSTAKDRKHIEEYHKHISDCCDSMNKYFSNKED